MNTKLGTLSSNATMCNYDILAFTETWLNQNVQNSEILDNKFTIFRSDRNIQELDVSRGGGVMLAVNSNLTALNLNLSQTNFNNIPSIDIIGLKIILDHYYFYLFVIYIPPNMSIDCYYSVFDAFCSLHYIFNSDILLIGDFNIPDYGSNNIMSLTLQAISNFEHFLELHQFNDVNNSNNRLLDLVLANRDCKVEKAVDVLLNEDSHHPSIVVLYRL